MTPHAVVVGASGGIGRALVDRLQADGWRVRGLARSFSGPDRIDLLDEASIAAAAGSLGDPPDLVIVATGLLHDAIGGPERSLRALDPDRLARSFAVNAIGPALVAKHVLPLMPRDRRHVFAALSARVGSIADNRLGGWHGYRASKAALNMLIRTIAIEQAGRAPLSIVAGLHPGTVDTALSAPFQRNLPPGQLVAADKAAGDLLAVIDGLRPDDSGWCLDWRGQRILP